MFYCRLIFLVLFISCASSAWTMGDLSSLRVQSPLIGMEAPDVVLSKMDGTSASIIGSREGQKAILVFWATWCPHCYEELGFINAHLASIEQKGVKIILVDIGESKEDVSNYFKERQMKLMSFLDENGYLQETYHLIGVPTIMFIDEKGIVQSSTHQFPSDYENYFSSK